MEKITPFLWFNDQAEEAVKFYTSVFKNSKILSTSHYDEAGAEVSGRKKGSVMVIDFKIQGQRFSALNGGPIFKFSQATSFVINCKDQKEVDYYYNKLTKGGQIQPCGWLIDKYGVAWQVVPTEITKLMQGKNSEKVMKAMLQMEKLDINKLKQAAKNST